jgi:hypothetical protein
VTSLLQGAATWVSTGENVMWKKLAEMPAVELNSYVDKTIYNLAHPVQIT